ncbi:MAG: PDZ domain-containing protein [Planctomycetota bacterium]
MITSQVKRVIAVSVIIGLFCAVSVYASVSANGGNGGKDGDEKGSGGSGGNGTIIIGAPQQIPSKENETVATEEINRLIKELNSDDIAVRDGATDGLKKIGRPALPLLEEAARSNDPEVAWRAKIIIKAVTKAEQKKQQQQDESPESLPKKIGPTLKQFSNRFNITINNASPGAKSFALSQDSSGKVTVTITEYDKDGKQTGKTYTADSLDEFKKKYPKIAKEYGIGENPPSSIEVPNFDMDDIWKDFGNAWGQRWDDLRKQMEKLKDMFKQYNPDVPGIKPPQKPTTPPNSTNPDGFSERKPGTGHSEATANLGIFIESISNSLKQKSNIENGVLVTGVEGNSLGEKMGLKENDIIVSVNDSEAKTIWEYRRLIKTALENSKIKLTVIRNDRKETLVYPK